MVTGSDRRNQANQVTIRIIFLHYTPNWNVRLGTLCKRLILRLIRKGQPRDENLWKRL